MDVSRVVTQVTWPHNGGFSFSRYFAFWQESSPGDRGCPCSWGRTPGGCSQHKWDTRILSVTDDHQDFHGRPLLQGIESSAAVSRQRPFQSDDSKRSVRILFSLLNSRFGNLITFLNVQVFFIGKITFHVVKKHAIFVRVSVCFC